MTSRRFAERGKARDETGATLLDRIVALTEISPPGGGGLGGVWRISVGQGG